MKKAVLLLVALLLTSCNDNKIPKDAIPIENQPSADGEIVDIIAENWTFDKNSYVVPAGEITVNLKNIEGFHGIQIDGTDVSIEGDGSFTTTLEPGEYTIFCSIICGTGHSNMIATLIVEE